MVFGKKKKQVKLDLEGIIDATIKQTIDRFHKDYLVLPKSSQTRYRVEVSGETIEMWKDSGLVFNTVDKAEQYCREFVPHNLHWRIMFETMNVVKYNEYKPPYLR